MTAWWKKRGLEFPKTVFCYSQLQQHSATAAVTKRELQKKLQTKIFSSLNPKADQGNFLKGLRCLKHIIQDFEETNSVYFETLKYQVKNTEFHLKNLLHSALQFHTILLCAYLLNERLFKTTSVYGEVSQISQNILSGKGPTRTTESNSSQWPILGLMTLVLPAPCSMLLKTGLTQRISHL